MYHKVVVITTKVGAAFEDRIFLGLGWSGTKGGW